MPLMFTETKLGERRSIWLYIFCAIGYADLISLAIPVLIHILHQPRDYNMVRPLTHRKRRGCCTGRPLPWTYLPNYHAHHWTPRTLFSCRWFSWMGYWLRSVRFSHCAFHNWCIGVEIRSTKLAATVRFLRIFSTSCELIFHDFKCRNCHGHDGWNLGFRSCGSPTARLKPIFVCTATFEVLRCINR